ncbi:hypothetical protein bcere0022_42250 [Bacillus cereus Rock3-44]|nr:hypothetical protein bcere0022_42250 [Bacillus cereus Rock3-44]
MEAARLECEGDGASDVEAFFASEEGAKPPNILAAGAVQQVKIHFRNGKFLRISI